VSYLEENRATWDDRAQAHAESGGYHVADFIADSSYLSEVVQFDRPRLGDLTGLEGIHLQCHIGTDTISLARLGARMAGLDFSERSLEMARDISTRCGTPVEFVRGELYEAPEVLGRHYDFVFTGIGALCWLPDIAGWATVVRRLLKPGGRLLLREGHPMLWALDEKREDGLLVVRYPYFETIEPLTEETAETYVETDAILNVGLSHSWNHGLGEVMGALMNEGFAIRLFEEHRSAPWNALPGHMVVGDDGEWRLTADADRLPLTYTLHAELSR
jgi:SAM-dependent methyltransferase